MVRFQEKDHGEAGETLNKSSFVLVRGDKGNLSHHGVFKTYTNLNHIKLKLLNTKRLDQWI